MMKTLKCHKETSKIKMDKNVCTPRSIIHRWALIFMSIVLISCGKDGQGQEPDPEPTGTGEIKGMVKDEKGNLYPNTVVVVSKGSEKSSGSTDIEGAFSIVTKSVGTYSVEIDLPLSTEAVSANPVSAEVKANQTTTMDFVIQPQYVKANLNFGSVQLLEEIVDKNGNTPSNPNEPIFAKNIFDEPIGQLNEVKAPDGHQVSLSEFQTAKGNLLVQCNGDSSTIGIALEGMIPNGTYTFWLAYLNKTRKVGESIDFANDFVNFTNPPIGPSNGSGNVVVAGSDGKIETTLEHNSCILTDEVALVIPILYHINGNTFGGGHVPDAEEMVHMLVYFQ